MLNKKLLTTFCLVVGMLVPQGAWATAYGSSKTISWSVSEAIEANSTLTLRGMTIALGKDIAWTFGSSACTPAEMPYVMDGETKKGDFTYSTTIPEKGGFLKISPTASGTITITNSEAGYNPGSGNPKTQMVHFVTTSDGSTIESDVTAEPVRNATHTYSVVSGKIYYFYQQYNGSSLTSGRWSLKSIRFDTTPTSYVWNFLEDADTWKSRTSAGTYDGLTLAVHADTEGKLTYEKELKKDPSHRYTYGKFSFTNSNPGYLVIENKGASGNVKYNDGTDHNVNNSNNAVTTVAVSEIKDYVVTVNNGSLFALSFIETGSAEDLMTKSITLDNKGFATYTPYYNVSIPEGVKAYFVKSSTIGDNKFTFSQVTEQIPANAAVILVGEANQEITFTQYTTSGVKAIGSTNASYGGDKDGSTNIINYMHPAFKSGISLNPDDYDYYGYVKGEGKFGKVTSTVTIPKGRCYFRTAKSAGARAFIDMDFSNVDDSETTGVSNSKLGIMNSGQVFYDLQGRRVGQPKKGLYIVNGKKVIIK